MNYNLSNHLGNMFRGIFSYMPSNTREMRQVQNYYYLPKAILNVLAFENNINKMSFIDLAALTWHRRNELEGRINQFSKTCAETVRLIKNLDEKARCLVTQLNCESFELKDRFLSCTKQLDEYMYFLTDFNLAAAQLADASGADSTPVLDTSYQTLSLQKHDTLSFNLLDALSEPTPSTSTTVPDQHQIEKQEKPPQEQLLIQFSSSSSSIESVQNNEKNDVTAKDVQCYISEDLKNLSLELTSAQQLKSEPCKLPAQPVLEIDSSFQATIMHVDGIYFWVIIDPVDEVYGLLTTMTDYYKKNTTMLSLDEIQTLAYCAAYDEECYYRGLFVNISKENPTLAHVFLVDTGESRIIAVRNIKPLYPQFCEKPPYARCCHLAGIDLVNYHDESLMRNLDEFMLNLRGTFCRVIVDDNSSETLGVYIIMCDKRVLQDLIIATGLARPTDKKMLKKIDVGNSNEVNPLELDLALDINGPEYEDPVEAVTGYHNRDEIDICKHYKGGPEKTCFKGARCTKKHIMKHPDGWTMDRVEVLGKCKPLPLPEPDTWHKVYVTCVCHYDRVYVQFVNDVEEEKVPDFGVILPPTTLNRLAKDMNSAATRQTYQPLTLSPAPGEMVASLYPFDNNWYRAQVLSLTRSDQSVEVLYVDYGTTLWVKEDRVRVLEPQYMALPAQAVRCVLAGVAATSQCSKQWAAAKAALAKLVLEQTLEAHVVSREYDEIVVELYDKKGYSIAEQLASQNLVELVEYEIKPDKNVTQKVVVP